MDAARNARAYSQTVFELSGQPYDPDDPELHTACSQTCRNLLADVSTAELESVLELSLRMVIRAGGLQVTDEILDEAFETFQSGEKKQWDVALLQRVARHEAGHAFLC
jgi:hypothetical protein